MSNTRPVITKACQLEEYSSWRKYREGLQEVITNGSRWEDLEAVRNGFARESYLAFCDVVTSGEFKVTPFHEIIGSAFEDLANKRYDKLIISCPPRSGKTKMIQLFLAWLLGRDKGTSHLLSSYAQPLSKHSLRNVIDITDTAEFRSIFPDWTGFDSESESKVLGGGTLFPSTVGGSLCGFSVGSSHAESLGVGAMILDSPFKNPKSAFSERESLFSWLEENVSIRLIHNHCQVLIDTLLGDSDYFKPFTDRFGGAYCEESNPNGWRRIDIDAT